MADNKINPLFNIHEKYREVIIINPYRFSDPDAVAQAARIVADGGTIVDFAFMNLVISTMKSMGIYSNAKLLTDANFGVKKNSSTGAVSKLYDISGNNNDAVQATGASQPIWSLVNGRGVITYDGVDDYLDLGTSKFNFNIGTLCIGLGNKGTNKVAYWWARSPNADAWANFGIVYQGSALKMSNNKTICTYASVSNNDRFCFACNNTSVSVYKNGNSLINLTEVNSLNGAGMTNPLSIGRAGGFSNYYFDGSFRSHTLFDINLTQSQITQLYNLGL